MIALDIGGTKTSIYFSREETYERFVNTNDSEFISLRPEIKVCTISSENFTKSKDALNSFLEHLSDMDDEIIATFPGMVRMLKSKNKMKFLARTHKFGLNKELELKVSFAVNDVYAFAYHHADLFFSNPSNRKKKLLAIQIGTGVNALCMNICDFKELLFLNKIIEAGHITMRQGGWKCSCGRKGCAELYVSGKFLEKIGGGYMNVFRNKRLREKFYENLAEYVSSLLLVHAPDKLVLGGSVFKSIEPELLRNRVLDKCPYVKHAEWWQNMEYEVDVSSISNLRGLIDLYKKLKKQHPQLE